MSATPPVMYTRPWGSRSGLRPTRQEMFVGYSTSFFLERGGGDASQTVRPR